MKLALFALGFAALAAHAQVTPPEHGLGFEQALRQIVDRNPGVGVQRATLEATRARNLPNQLTLLPSVSLKAADAWNNQAGADNEMKTLQLEAGLNLFHFGSDLYTMRAASAEVAAAELQVNDAIIRAEDEGVKALVGVVQADLEVDILKRILDMRSDSLKVARERFDRGLLAQEEVDKVSIDFDNARAELRDKEIIAATARATLTNLLGNDDIQVSWPWASDWEKETTKLLASDADLSHRPDWRAAERTREAASRRAQASWSKIWPSVDVNFTYGYFDVGGGFLPGGGYSPPFAGKQWSAGVALTIPLFDKLVNYSSYREQAAERQSAEATLTKVQRQAKAEWQAARRSLEVALESAKARDATLSVSRRLYQANLRRFRVGYADANQLSIDQQRLYSSEQLDVQGWAAVHQYFGQLCHALGFRLAECLHRE